MLECEEIARLVSDELIQVYQTVKEYADLVYVLAQLLQREVTLGGLRLNHVIHLAEQVDKENGLVIEILQSVDLLLVKVVHFVRCNHPVVVEVDHSVPVLERALRRLVFLTEHEPDEILVAHLAFLARLELARDLLENSIDCLAGQRVSLVPRKVLLVDQKVVIGVQLPESAVQYVEVLVRKVLSHFVDVLLGGHVVQDLI